jgi:hypothetical protein
LQQIEIFLYMHTYVDTHTKARNGTPWCDTCGDLIMKRVYQLG